MPRSDRDRIGHLKSESAVTPIRKPRSGQFGISGHDWPEYVFLGFSSLLIAADHEYDVLDPAGIHTLLNAMYSPANLRLATGVVCLERLRLVAQHPSALELLRVCWHDAGYNCGRCEKCIRTRATPTLPGVRAARLEPMHDWRELRSIESWWDTTLEFWRDLLTLAHE